ncbi:MAG: tetratricopeptide repeat protein [Isosphaeraceae bacterium]
MDASCDPEFERGWRRHLSEHSDDARGYAAIALILAKRGDVPGATVEAERSIALDPGLALPHYVLSRVAWPSHVDEAIREARKAIELDSECVYYYSQLAHLELHHPRSAVDRMHRAAALRAAEDGLEIQPDDPSCATIRGMALAQTGRFDEAEAAFAKAIALDPECAYVHSSRGQYLFSRGDLVPALRSFERASQLEPSSMAYHRWWIRRLTPLILLLTGFTKLTARLGLIHIDRVADSVQTDRWTVKPDWSMGLVYGLWAMASLRVLLDFVGDSSPLWFCIPAGVVSAAGIPVLHRLDGTKRWTYGILLMFPILLGLQLPLMMLLVPDHISELAGRSVPRLEPMPEFQLTRLIGVFSFVGWGLFLGSLLLAKVIERNKPA